MLVYHAKFGTGIVLATNHRASKPTALVRWATHTVMRVTKSLGQNESHVNLASLKAF
jgi:hypothetical protein